jgi:hypothetical protein
MISRNEDNILSGTGDDFRDLVDRCIEAYEKLNNDGLALNLCKVSDKRLRIMVLSDEQYITETKNIYARQKLEEIEEVEHLAKLAANEMQPDDDDDEYTHPSDRKKKSKQQKTTPADRDLLNIRFKAAQLKRELRAEMANAVDDVEKDAVNLLYVPVTKEELERMITIELHAGSDDVDIDGLISKKEEVPTGSSGKLSSKGRATKIKEIVEEVEDYFDELPDGEIVEK